MLLMIKSRFRNDNNQRWTRNLFLDCQRELPIEQRVTEPLYTLHHDVEGFVNFRRVYVELGDPSGYLVSQQLLEDYSHWQQLMKSPWFREAKEIWDQELNAKMAAEGRKVIRMFADGIEGVAPAVQLNAAKYLADLAKPKSAPRGRPSKEEVAGNLKQQTTEAAEIEADLERINNVLSFNRKAK